MTADTSVRPGRALVRTWAVTIPVAVVLQFAVGALAALGAGTPVLTALTVLAYALTAFVAGMVHRRAAPAARPVVGAVAVAAVPAVLLIVSVALAAEAGADAAVLLRTLVLPAVAVVAGGLVAARVTT